MHHDTYTRVIDFNANRFLAVDHPHGGGRGKSKSRRHPVTPWGRPVRPQLSRAKPFFFLAAFFSLNALSLTLFIDQIWVQDSSRAQRQQMGCHAQTSQPRQATNEFQGLNCSAWCRESRNKLGRLMEAWLLRGCDYNNCTIQCGRYRRSSRGAAAREGRTQEHPLAQPCPTPMVFYSESQQT